MKKIIDSTGEPVKKWQDSADRIKLKETEIEDDLIQEWQREIRSLDELEGKHHPLIKFYDRLIEERSLSLFYHNESEERLKIIKILLGVIAFQSITIIVGW